MTFMTMNYVFLVILQLEHSVKADALLRLVIMMKEGSLQKLVFLWELFLHNACSIVRSSLIVSNMFYFFKHDLCNRPLQACPWEFIYTEIET